MSFPVCKFYKSNRNCKFGDNCHYLHSDTSQRPPPPTEYTTSNGAVNNTRDQQASSPNTDFAINNFKGTNHEASLKSSTQTNIRPGTSDLDTSVTRLSIDDASNSVNPQTTKTQPRKICSYFKQHGHCAFGRNCRFVHGDAAESAPTHQPRFTQQNARRQIPPRFQRTENGPGSKSTSEHLEPTGINEVTEPNPRAVVLGDSVNDREPNRQTEKSINNNDVNDSRRNGKLCRHFKAGYCYRGRRCMFMHYRDDKVRKNEEGSSKMAQIDKDDARHDGAPKSSVTAKELIRYERSSRPSGVLPQVVTLSDLQINGTEKYRQFDVNYLEKRFQAVRQSQTDEGECEESPKTNSDELIMEVHFAPSDPDWPFDIRTFVLDLTLPNDYPEKPMSVGISVHKQDLPETVRRYLEVTMNEWICNRQGELTKNSKAELMVRPFFRWLDRSFEDVMTEALTQLKRELTARAAGFEFIPATHLKAKYVVDDNEDDGSGSNGEASDSLAEDDDESSDECLESDDESEDDSDDDEEKQPGLSLDTDRKGTEIQLRHLQLKQNASSLMLERLRLILQCGRCKHHSEVSVGNEKAVALTCEKCNHEMYVQYRPTLAHQFSSIVGYLDLDSCQAFDLIFPDCKIAVSCFSCGKVSKINGMMSGQMVDGWCQACNAKFKFATEAVKFYQLQPSDLDDEKKRNAEVSRTKTLKKPPKDPAIREGQPLPEFGTCRHYKQSYRWLRFPCCGKAYPCDVCHDKKEDHEMILATRMICGHCCKEQNYSASKPCVSCSHHMTKVHSSHWEGGAGCRDRIAMSRNDQHKYKNMNKTISRKKGQSAGGAKKKNTKLRHA